MVTNPLDDGSAGSLRYEIGIAQSGDKILFADNLAGQTITLNPAYGRLFILNLGGLTIQGPGGASRVTISGAALSNQGIFRISVDSALPPVTLSNLALVESNFRAVQENGGNLNLQNCEFSDNSGGAMDFFGDGQLNVDHCTFSDNGAEGVGGAAIFASQDVSVSITHSSFSNNNADSLPSTQPPALRSGGGAIYMVADGTLTIDDCVFSGNHADNGKGGAIATFNVTSISHCTFSGNHADGGAGGAVIDLANTMTIDYSTFSDNHADGGSGGAIANLRGIELINHSNFSGNHADGGTGGAIFNSSFYGGPGILTLSASAMSGNSANAGGGIYNDVGCQGTIQDSTDCGNIALLGGDLYNLGTAKIISSDVCDIFNG
jgi:predicted outer membrane repeat protein